MAVEVTAVAISTITSAADEALAAEVRARGDAAAYNELVDRYTWRLVAYCKGRLPMNVDVEDVVQEVWARVWTKRELFTDEGPTSFRRWLFTLTGRACIDAFRRTRSDVHDDERLREISDEGTSSPDWLACMSERRLALESCIAELSSRQQCIVRATLSGEKPAVAAERCGCTAPQASTAKHQAIRALRECTSRKGV